ncbi:MAG: hypothetical protein ACRD1Z_09665, partial [Vicinamibacteria bacterium]
MDKLLRLGAPVKKKALDNGEQVTVEHRMGKDGALTALALMDRLGLEQEYHDYVKDLEKKFRDRDKFKRLREDFYRGQREKMNGVVRKYRRYLETFYGNSPTRPLLPMLAFVPISDKADGLYFQGLLDVETLKLVVGEPEDEELYNETIFIRTKP